MFRWSRADVCTPLDDVRIRATRRRVVYQNPRIRIHRDDVVFPGGHRGDYTVIEKPEFVLVVPVEGNTVWLVQQYRYPLGQRAWEFPQGTWPLDVESPAVRADEFAGAVRGDIRELAEAELREETGLTAGSLDPIGVFAPASGYSNQRVHAFRATDVRHGDTDREATEHDMIARRFGFDEVRAMIADGAIIDVCSVAAFCLVDASHAAGSADLSRSA